MTMNGNNNFIMTTIDSERFNKTPERPREHSNVLKYEEGKRMESEEYDPDNSQFMRPLAQNKHHEPKNIPKINKSVVLSKEEIQKSLREIFDFYAKSYDRPVKEHTSFNHITSEKIIMQAYFLFCKNFHILKAIFTIERLTVIFKKHADYGKYLSFDNFFFMINSMSHEAESKKFFHLEEMTKNLDIQTVEELERQEFYNYLQLSSPERYRQNFGELFKAFNMNLQPESQKKNYNYRKFSLPELRKKAIPEPKDKKKIEKDLFILKHDKQQIQQNMFDEAKSIVVSWDSLRAKSVQNLGKSEEIVEKKYLKADPEDDPYLLEVRPSTKKSPRRSKQVGESKVRQFVRGKAGGIEQKIKQIQKSEKIKNQKILERIEKKVNVRSSHKLKI